MHMRLLFATLAMLNLATGAARAADETEVTAPGPLGELHGSYIAPAEAKPVALIIPGSGPTDRDGNSVLGVKAASLRLIAEGLADQGIGSVRIDKRGMYGSAAAVADANAVTIADYVEDVESWIARIRQESGRSCVWLIGHSEGGLVALAAASRLDGICGLVLLAVPGRPFGTLLREQLQANPANAPILAQALDAIARLEQGERIDVTTLHPALQGLFAPQVQGYLIDIMAQDPARLAAQSQLPLLIIQGDADLQVKLADAELIQAARPDARLTVLPGVNHVLKQVPTGDQAANIASYTNADLPLAPGILTEFAGFLDAHKLDDIE